MQHSYFDLATPIVIGHRGAAGERPENTLPSFEWALRQGAAILETDVHATRDGAVVTLHDPTVDRTTDGRGVIADLTLAELRRLDAGSRFSPDGGATFPFRGRGVRIPTLEELFTGLPDARVNVEIKAASPSLVPRVVELVAKYGRADRTLLVSGEPEIMESIRRHLAQTGVPVAVGASSADVLRFVAALRDGIPPPPGAMALQIPSSFAGQPLVTRELVEFAHRHNVQVHVWTVNEAAEMHRLLDLGVDGLVTDLPGRMLAILAERRGTA